MNNLNVSVELPHASAVDGGDPGSAAENHRP